MSCYWNWKCVTIHLVWIPYATVQWCTGRWPKLSQHLDVKVIYILKVSIYLFWKMLGCEGVEVGFGCVDIFRGYRLNQNTKPFMCIWGHWDCVFEPKSIMTIDNPSILKVYLDNE